MGHLVRMTHLMACQDYVREIPDYRLFGSISEYVALMNLLRNMRFVSNGTSTAAENSQMLLVKCIFDQHPVLRLIERRVEGRFFSMQLVLGGNEGGFARLANELESFLESSSTDENLFLCDETCSYLWAPSVSMHIHTPTDRMDAAALSRWKSVIEGPTVYPEWLNEVLAADDLDMFPESLVSHYFLPTN